MNRLKMLILGCTAISWLALAQLPDPTPEPKLPDGRSQREELLKHEHKKSIEDAGDLVKLAEQLKAELERDDRHVLSIGTLKKTEDIEKLAKRIRSRLKRY